MLFMSYRVLFLFLVVNHLLIILTLWTKCMIKIFWNKFMNSYIFILNIWFKFIWMIFIDHYHCGHGEISIQTPQVFPGANLIYPLSPQLVPHEFLIFQYWSVNPTRVISWLRLVPQLLKIPLAYLLQLVASAETPITLEVTAFWIPVHPFAVPTLAILYDPPLVEHDWVLAV